MVVTGRRSARSPTRWCSALVQCLVTMLEYRFRHLPVLDGERLVGVLSCRDIPVNHCNMRERRVAAHDQPKEAAA